MLAESPDVLAELVQRHVAPRPLQIIVIVEHHALLTAFHTHEVLAFCLSSLYAF